MKLYISGPMACFPNFNRPAFDSVASKLRHAGHEAWNPAEQPEELEYREHMALDLAWICEHAEGIVMLNGWRTSPGAKAEYSLALALKLDIYFWPRDARKL